MSLPTLEYDKVHCKIFHENDPNCIRLVWTGFSKPHDFQEACNFALDLLIKYQTDKLIVDNRDSTVVSKENQDWLAQEWYPKAYAKGYRSSAVILGDNALNQLSIKKIESVRTGGDFNTKHFSDIAEAKQWLKSL